MHQAIFFSPSSLLINCCMFFASIFVSRGLKLSRIAHITVLVCWRAADVPTIAHVLTWSGASPFRHRKCQDRSIIQDNEDVDVALVKYRVSAVQVTKSIEARSAVVNAAMERFAARSHGTRIAYLRTAC